MDFAEDGDLIGSLEGASLMASPSDDVVMLGAAAKPEIGLRERNKIAKYNRILEAGRMLFSERGFEATTTQAVAQAAGIGVGTLFSYVSTKEDLLIIVFMDDLQTAVKTAFGKVRDDDPLLESILTLYDGLLQYHINNFNLSRYLMREVVNVSNPSAVKIVSNLMSNIKIHTITLIEREQNLRGYSKIVPNDILAKNCFAIYYDVLQGTKDEGGSLLDVANVLRDRMKIQIEPYYVR